MDQMEKLSLPGWPRFTDAEIDAVVRVLRSGKVNQWSGHEVVAFEKELAEAVGVSYATAVTSGTVALELSLEALGIGPGDEVITSCHTFLASASCALRVGAVPVFADIDPDSGNMTAGTISRVITPRTKAIVVVHIGGWPCDMDAIMALSKKHGLLVVEDCAQAIGARYNETSVGAFGHMAAFSFCNDKIITTGGEGGMIVTNDKQLWARIWSLKDHGKNYEAVFHRDHPPGYRWLHDGPGTNQRMTEMQAAIGRVACRDLANRVRQRRANAQALIDHFRHLPVMRIPTPPAHITHSYYELYTYLVADQLAQGWDRDRILVRLQDAGVPVTVGDCPCLYREKIFTREAHASRYADTHCPVSEEMGAGCLNFKVYHTLGKTDMDAIALTSRTIFQAATK